MIIQNNSSSLYSAQDDSSIYTQGKTDESQAISFSSLHNFSEKAVLVFEKLTAGYTSEQKQRVKESLASIGKAAAFAATNGFTTQNERNIVSQYFGNFSGVLSDEAIRKMIHTKLDEPSFENREFLEKFAQELSQPLQGINIRV